jgi:hypothetical protein
MEAWTIQIDNVDSATGVLTQLYPPWMEAGSAPAAGVEVRQPVDGVLYELTIYPDDAQGGILELVDIAGELSGSNDTNTATDITNAYLVAQQARDKARIIWIQEFKADPGLTTKKFTQRVPIRFGLAARWYTAGVAADTKTCRLNIVAEGCYRKVTVQGS